MGTHRGASPQSSEDGGVAGGGIGGASGGEGVGVSDWSPSGLEDDPGSLDLPMMRRRRLVISKLIAQFPRESVIGQRL